MCVTPQITQVSFFLFHGQVVELVDTQVSKTCAERRVGSSPTLATKIKLEKKLENLTANILTKYPPFTQTNVNDFRFF